MKKTNKLYRILVLCVLTIFIGCNPEPTQQQQTEIEEETDQDLEKQSDEFSKSMDNLDETLDVANQLNQRIQLVEKRFQDGEITREHADELIQALNRRFGQKLELASTDSVVYIYPSWLLDIGISEPKGLVFDSDNSFQTKENNRQDGYNSVLYIYHGNYRVAMREADRIAKAAGIPMSENYRKARELSNKLGKEIEGLKGVTYMNYEFGDKEFSQPYKISISVDEKGKFTLNVADVKTKIEHEKAGSTPVRH